MAATKKAPTRRKTTPKAKPKIDRIYLACGDCYEDQTLRTTTIDKMKEQLPDFIENCCSDQDCVTVYEVVRTYKVQKVAVSLKEQSLDKTTCNY